MPVRSKSAGKKSSGKKGKKKLSKNNSVDPRQEQIDGLIRERDDMRSKLNAICTKIIEHVNIDDYLPRIDLTRQQPSDISLENMLRMIDNVCHYRLAFLNLYHETDDADKISVEKRITQLSKDAPDLFRRPLKLEQRLSFVIRERDLWKDNAKSLQIMYASIGT
jgi:hypothetical protein